MPFLRFVYCSFCFPELKKLLWCSKHPESDARCWWSRAMLRARGAQVGDRDAGTLSPRIKIKEIERCRELPWTSKLFLKWYALKNTDHQHESPTWKMFGIHTSSGWSAWIHASCHGFHFLSFYLEIWKHKLKNQRFWSPVAAISNFP